MTIWGGDMRVTQQYAESIRCKLPPGAHDHTGKTRERLTFLWPTTERDGSSMKWAALCSCGNHALVGRRAHSCGCLNTIDRNWGGKPRLSADAVFSIRSSSEKGLVLAIQYGVSESTISSVRSGRRYGHLQEQERDDRL